MFTFIRQIMPGAKPPATDSFSPAIDCREPDASERISNNPWQSELERLAHRKPMSARFNKDVPKPPEPLPRQTAIKRGTLTDLKIWWGKATLYQTPGPSALNKFAPSTGKKHNRWQQF